MRLQWLFDDAVTIFTRLPSIPVMGDFLSKLSQRLTLNKLRNLSVLSPNQTLKYPDATVPSTRTPLRMLRI